MRVFGRLSGLMVLSTMLLVSGNASAEGKIETATDKVVAKFMELNTDPYAEPPTVDFEEYMNMVNERAANRFYAMDKDQDGEVTEEEYREFWSREKAKYYRLKR